MDDDPREELRRLTAGFRGYLEARRRSGTLGVGRGPSPRFTMAAARAEGGPAPHGGPPTPPAAASRAVEPLAARPAGAAGLEIVRSDLGDCRRCKLCERRTNIVFGVGDPNASLVFVGEGPGADEDAQGEPFVGLAGQLLNKMIAAMGLAREDVYICNVVKCRPPGNRNPEPDEIAACQPFLERQIDAIRPRMIVTLGKFAAHALLRETTPISRLRGTFRVYRGVPLMPTYHPAYLLRDPSKKGECWSDLKAVVAELARVGVTAKDPGPRAP